MGLSASQARFLSLTSRKSSIEFKGQQINQKRMILSSEELQYAQQMTNLMNTADFNTNNYTVDQNTGKLILADATSDAEFANDYNVLIDQISAIHADDKVLEMNLKDVDTQHNEVQTEIDAVKKVIDKNIDMTFKTFA